jgi:hypothetical protein
MVHKKIGEKEKLSGARSRVVARIQYPCMVGLLILTMMLSACAPGDTRLTSPSSPQTRTPIQLEPTPATVSTSDQTSTPTPSDSDEPPTVETPTLVPIPPISNQDWSRGPENAPINLIVYSDFQ